MNYKENINKWLESSVVSDSVKAEILSLSEKEKEDAFWRELEFGTGGLRGIMGAGTNRMNIYTVRRATQGLALYILNKGSEAARRGVAIAYDSRNNSALFANECAKVLTANGIKSYIFDGLRPTPELSFAVRHLGCEGGVVITASHNPKEYNGYKVYGRDGGQAAPEMASEILSYISSVDIFDGVKVSECAYSEVIGEGIDAEYIKSVKAESLGAKIPENFSVIYTPLHGSGNKPVRRILSEIGVGNVRVISEQELPNGDFPTVKSPNPENREAFDMAIEYAKREPCDVIIGTDPDSDRIGVVVPEKDGNFTVLNGNQTGVLICNYILEKMVPNIPKESRVVKTIVTTEMVRKIAESYGVLTVDVLTGFKYIGDKIKEYESCGEHFIFGLEESYGYLKGTYARDKDAVVAAMLIAELGAECKALGITLGEKLRRLYEKYGYHKEKLLSYTFSGIKGTEKIKSIMKAFRTVPTLPRETKRIDYLNGIDGLPAADVLKIFFEDGYLAARPSGTEPKIKFYISKSAASEAECDAKISDTSGLVEAIVNS